MTSRKSMHRDDCDNRLLTKAVLGSLWKAQDPTVTDSKIQHTPRREICQQLDPEIVRQTLARLQLGEQKEEKEGKGEEESSFEKCVLGRCLSFYDAIEKENFKLTDIEEKIVLLIEDTKNSQGQDVTLIHCMNRKGFEKAMTSNDLSDMAVEWVPTVPGIYTEMQRAKPIIQRVLACQMIEKETETALRLAGTDERRKEQVLDTKLARLEQIRGKWEREQKVVDDSLRQTLQELEAQRSEPKTPAEQKAYNTQVQGLRDILDLSGEQLIKRWHQRDSGDFFVPRRNGEIFQRVDINGANVYILRQEPLRLRRKLPAFQLNFLGKKRMGNTDPDPIAMRDTSRVHGQATNDQPIHPTYTFASIPERETRALCEGEHQKRYSEQYLGKIAEKKKVEEEESRRTAAAVAAHKAQFAELEAKRAAREEKQAIVEYAEESLPNMNRPGIPPLRMLEVWAENTREPPELSRAQLTKFIQNVQMFLQHSADLPAYIEATKPVADRLEDVRPRLLSWSAVRETLAKWYYETVPLPADPEEKERIEAVSDNLDVYKSVLSEQYETLPRLKDAIGTIREYLRLRKELEFGYSEAWQDYYMKLIKAEIEIRVLLPKLLEKRSRLKAKEERAREELKEMQKEFREIHQTYLTLIGQHKVIDLRPDLEKHSNALDSLLLTLEANPPLPYDYLAFHIVTETYVTLRSYLDMARQEPMNDDISAKTKRVVAFLLARNVYSYTTYLEAIPFSSWEETLTTYSKDYVGLASGQKAETDSNIQKMVKDHRRIVTELLGSLRKIEIWGKDAVRDARADLLGVAMEVKEAEAAKTQFASSERGKQYFDKIPFSSAGINFREVNERLDAALQAIGIGPANLEAYQKFMKVYRVFGFTQRVYAGQETDQRISFEQAVTMHEKALNEIIAIGPLRAEVRMGDYLQLIMLTYEGLRRAENVPTGWFERKENQATMARIHKRTKEFVQIVSTRMPSATIDLVQNIKRGLNSEIEHLHDDKDSYNTYANEEIVQGHRNTLTNILYHFRKLELLPLDIVNELRDILRTLATSVEQARAARAAFVASARGQEYLDMVRQLGLANLDLTKEEQQVKEALALFGVEVQF